MILELVRAWIYALVFLLGMSLAGVMKLVGFIGASENPRSSHSDLSAADCFFRPFFGLVAFVCLLGAFKLSRRSFGGSNGKLMRGKSQHIYASKSRSIRSCSGRVSFQIRSRALDKMVFPWLCVALCCRIGEAAVPGPNDVTFSIGVCNPSGLGAKAHLFDAQERADVWLVSESHLSSVGLRSFRRSLRALQSPYRWIVHGYPVQPRSVVSEIGQWTGVACISKHPSRALVHGWEDGINMTSRIVGSTTFCCNTWLTGVTVYGTPVGPTHPNAKQVTERLLSEAIQRIVQAVGCRFVAGDWNCDHSSLEGVAQLRALGFQDVQDLEFQRSAQCPWPTCRGKTRRDFLFVSPELAARFQHCRVDPLAWSDHASVVATFSGNHEDSVRSIWPIPLSCDWSTVSAGAIRPVCHFNQDDLDDAYRQFWLNKEQQVQQHAHAQGKVISPLAFGRGTRNQPVLSSASNPPIKKGRAGDLQPKFLGFSMLHLKWFRQLRRLRHFLRLVQAGVVSSNQQFHASQLWESILRAPGFQPSFSGWWQTRSRALGEVEFLPLHPPDAMQASLIFAAFEYDVRHLERTLTKHRNYAAKLRQTNDVNQLFKVVRRDAPSQVDVLVKEAVGVVTGVDADDFSVEFREPAHWVDSMPVVHQSCEYEVIHAEPDKLWLSDIAQFEVGDVVVQPHKARDHVPKSLKHFVSNGINGGTVMRVFRMIDGVSSVILLQPNCLR